MRTQLHAPYAYDSILRKHCNTIHVACLRSCGACVNEYVICVYAYEACGSSSFSSRDVKTAHKGVEIRGNTSATQHDGSVCWVGEGQYGPKKSRVKLDVVHQPAHAQVTSQNNLFRHLESQKRINLATDLLSLGTYAPGPQVLTFRSQILRGVRI